MISEDAFTIISYFNKRLEGLVKFGQYVEAIKIDLRFEESYGREYARISYRVDLDKDSQRQPIDILEQLDYYFNNFYSNSGFEFVSFIISSNERKNEKDVYLKRLKEIHDLYLTLTTSLCDIISNMYPKVQLRVASLDEHIQFNYLAKYWEDTKFSERSYQNYYRRDFERDVYQYIQLYNAQKHFKKQNALRNKRLISDAKINCHYNSRHYWDDFRGFILENSIPFKIVGDKTAEELLIDAKSLKNAILDLPENSPHHFLKFDVIKIVENEIKQTNLNETVEKDFLSDYILQPGDLLLLYEDKIVKIKSIGFNTFITIQCQNINDDLNPGKRFDLYFTTDVHKHLSLSNFNAKREEFGWTKRRQLIRYMKKLSSANL